ncbi:hypothetical protein SAMN04488104_101621 [Algoriphagus faecimaris]|uniref:HEPN/Toprim N-terminal domain-containing protein n=1 Tax=Algoriphagus faecimaris TaxID=686796 RepID=A0A1G6SAG7_9BACT|nr:HEPN/Toprim-associated domain-containing protein [Algoriphagus faecimaris]SDD13664.1 hypothetical protein SAMN04488104_101621 [Algoriphagus faecimaris]
MGSYSELFICNYPIFTLKNNYYHDIVDLIFLESDYTEYEATVSDEDNPEEEEIVRFKSFISTAEVCKERLEIFGASYEKAKLDFEESLKILREDGIYDFVIYESITFDFYLDTIKRIIESKKSGRKKDVYGGFEDYLYKSELYIDGQSISLGLWSILSVIDSKSIIEYNLTDIIEGGWVQAPQSLINTKKIILLTEGKTDTEFLKICFNYFFKHLEGYYHFMDFENSKYEANASRLIHTIKSFVGSGINNFILAVFDNDSAASKEIENLKKVNLPNNIKVLQYPEIEWAKNYPTLGPTGIQVMNINGLAGSIEMYLGKDCLMENGEFIPIQWTGYMESINKYQGVVLKKDQIQRSFREKVKFFDENNYDLKQWEDLISIITLIKNSWK